MAINSPTLFFYTLTFLYLFSLLLPHLTISSTPTSHFEGFGDELIDDIDVDDDEPSMQITDLPPSPSLTKSHSQNPLPSPPSHHQPQTESQPSIVSQPDYWDEDEFEGFSSQPPIKNTETTPPQESNPPPKSHLDSTKDAQKGFFLKYGVEIGCVTFLIMFVINYFTGKKENENLALSWAVKFANKDSIFDRNFSLLGVGEGDDSPLLLKEGQNVFRFYASGRRFCQGLLATMELKSRHDLISRVYNGVVSCKDEIIFEVYMNDEAMDQVVFAVARKKLAKGMIKEVPDLQKYGSFVSPPSNRKWVSEELSVISESKEVASDLITEAVLDQVFGDRAFEKIKKLFISMHFSDQQSGSYRKKLMFTFALPDANHMEDMTRLVALVPYYIDLVGRYKLSSQARSKTDSARSKAALEAYKEMQQARQEALQRKKADKKKMMEETEAKLSAEAIRKKEAKERARQLKKSMPKVKMSRA